MSFLEPIEKPNGILLKSAYWYSKKIFGKVLSPFKVIYARFPEITGLAAKAENIKKKKLKLPELYRDLIVALAAIENGCGFCQDLHQAKIVQDKVGKEKFKALFAIESAANLEEHERAMLLFSKKLINRQSIEKADVQSLKKYFSEREIVEIVWLVSIGTYFNLMSRGMGLESDGLTPS